MKTGISSYAFTWAVGVPGHHPGKPLSAHDLIDMTVEFGLENLQIADNLPLHLHSKSSLQQVKKNADEKNIQIEVGTKRLTDENLEQYLEIASLFQSPFLRIIIDDKDYQPDHDQIIGILKNQQRRFENANVFLAIENHDRFTARELVDILEKTGSPKNRICLDTVNSLGAGEGIETVTKILGPHTVNLHVKEFTTRRASHKMGITVEGLPLGKGLLPLEWICKQIQPSCYSAILEQWVPPEKTLEETIVKEKNWAIESVKYLKNTINK